jgi:hypothetical protein
VRARAGAGAARVAGEAGERDEAALAAVEVEAVKCEREPAPGRRVLQEGPERPMGLPIAAVGAHAAAGGGGEVRARAGAAKIGGHRGACDTP